jgi:negative regulator of flagellin synthesis FlgM
MNNGISTLQGLPSPQALSGPQSGTAASAAVKADSGATDLPAPEKADQTSLSTVSDLVANALSRVDANSDVRLEKILPIQQAIANGSYRVSASDVAGKIIDSLLT